jgi:hypothetical protein
VEAARSSARVPLDLATARRARTTVIRTVGSGSPIASRSTASIPGAGRAERTAAARCGPDPERSAARSLAGSDSAGEWTGRRSKPEEPVSPIGVKA